MKSLSLFNKIMYFLNIVLAISTFSVYILPFLSPKTFPFLAVFTLFMPFVFLLNGLFFIYWALQLKKRTIISGLVLLLGITFIDKFYKFSTKTYINSPKDFTIMSYNVRLFNRFKWIEEDNVPNEIVKFINKNNPEILCIQEYSNYSNVDLKVYPYKFIFMDGKNVKTGQAIFSKFPIVNQGTITFPNSDNNVVFADIKLGKNIVRIYNMHLQSIKISPDVQDIENNIEAINQQKSQILFKRISKAFMQQQEQAQIFVKHKRNCNYPIIICGDMNNSAFSYIYRVIKGNLNDSFEEAGVGFGETYTFKYYPARIDYIFADEMMEVKEFRSFPDFRNSDHYPIMAKLYLY